MSLPFLRPSPPPSTLYLRSFLLRSSSSGSSSRAITRSSPAHQLVKRSANRASYSTATSAPSRAAVPTSSIPAPGSTASISSPPPITPSSSSATTTTTTTGISSPGQQQQAPNQLPFFVHRTASQNLPVYTDKKSGGTRKQTVVRKIEGDKDALRQILIDSLPNLLQPEHVVINRLTGQIVIKGHVAREVAGVLRGLRF